MKKILLIGLIVLSSLCFGEDIIMYSNDVATGETIDNGSKEAQINSMKALLKKIERYKELKAKENLTGAEVEEMMELKDYIVVTYQKMQTEEELERKRQAALAEQEVLNNISRQPTEEELRAIQEENERRRQEQSETVMGSLFKKILK